MKSKDDALKWIPLWVDKWLFGSTRIELKPDERSVWVDLMALSSKDNGFVRANLGVPYPLQQLAGMLYIDVELLERTMERCKVVGKIVEISDGTFFLPSWNGYKLSPRHKRRFTPEKEDASQISDPMSAQGDTVSSKVGLNRVEESREENSREEKEGDSSLIFECEFFKIERSYHRELQTEFPLVDLVDLYKRLRNGCKDDPQRYKRDVRGQIKNLRNTVRNWCLKAKPCAPESKNPDQVEPIKIECKWCHKIYVVREGHTCEVKS